jgi:hypothetical protein
MWDEPGSTGETDEWSRMNAEQIARLARNSDKATPVPVAYRIF